jgi:hypothetical protein
MSCSLTRDRLHGQNFMLSSILSDQYEANLRRLTFLNQSRPMYLSQLYSGVTCAYSPVAIASRMEIGRLDCYWSSPGHSFLSLVFSSSMTKIFSLL